MGIVSLLSGNSALNGVTLAYIDSFTWHHSLALDQQAIAWRGSGETKCGNGEGVCNSSARCVKYANYKVVGWE